MAQASSRHSRRSKKHSSAQGAAARIKAKAVATKKKSKAEEHVEKKRHEALERQFAKGLEQREGQGQLSPHPTVARANLETVNVQIPQSWSPEGAVELNPALPQDLSRKGPSNRPMVWPTPAIPQFIPPFSQLSCILPRAQSTFTPSAAGLCPGGPSGSDMSDSMREVVSSAIRQAIADGIHQLLGQL
ncbi:hypothetical protein E2320_002225 [Naja naja]|nr:hypothetical protein E2320_002225 [Naja naja]